MIYSIRVSLSGEYELKFWDKYGCFRTVPFWSEYALKDYIKRNKIGA